MKIQEVEAGARILFETERAKRPQEGKVVEFAGDEARPKQWVNLGAPAGWEKSGEVTVLHVFEAKPAEPVVLASGSGKKEPSKAGSTTETKAAGN